MLKKYKSSSKSTRVHNKISKIIIMSIKIQIINLEWAGSWIHVVIIEYTVSIAVNYKPTAQHIYSLKERTIN